MPESFREQRASGEPVGEGGPSLGLWAEVREDAQVQEPTVRAGRFGERGAVAGLVGERRCPWG